MKKILLVIIVAMIFILYLVQHRLSVIYTQEITRLETELEMRKDEVLKLEGEKNRAYLFANLEKMAATLGLTYSQASYFSNEKNQISAEKISTNTATKND